MTPTNWISRARASRGTTMLAMVAGLLLATGCDPSAIPIVTAPIRPTPDAAPISCFAAINGKQLDSEVPAGFNPTPEWGNIYGCGHTAQRCATPGDLSVFTGPVPAEPTPVPLRVKVNGGVHAVNDWDEANGNAIAGVVGLVASISYDSWTVIAANTGRPRFRCSAATSYDSINHWNIWMTPESFRCKNWTSIAIAGIPFTWNGSWYACNANGQAI